MIVQNKKKTDKIKKLPIKGKTLMVKKKKVIRRKSFNPCYRGVGQNGTATKRHGRQIDKMRHFGIATKCLSFTFFLFLY